MKYLKAILFILLLSVGTTTQGQDLHFSQISASPTFLNPAYAGFMPNNVRMNASYRNQWFTVSSFSTYAFSADANIIRSQLDYDMLGVGLSFFEDIEEKEGYKNTNISLTAAYNLKLSNKPLQYIGFGMQPSFILKQINLMDAVYGTFFETGVNTDPLGFSEYKKFKFDLNMGLSYYIFMDTRHIINIGFTMSHINRPDFGIYAEDKLYRKYTAYLLTEFEAGQTGTAWMKPMVYFSQQGPSTELMGGLGVRFKFFNAINDIFLGFNGMVRFVGHNEANIKSTDFVGGTQLTIQMFTVGFSYDVAIGDVNTASGRNGGPEVSLAIDLKTERRMRPRYFKMIAF